jgi:hypothetical protein
MGMLLVLSVGRTYISWRQRQAPRVVDIMLTGCFALALFLSFGRTSWMLGLMGITGIFFFTSPVRTKLFYIFAFGGFLLIIFNSEYIFDKLPEWERDLPMNSISTQQAFRISTYSDRLMGFMTFAKDRSYWTAFGVKGFTFENQHYGDRYFTHDAFTGALLSYGFVGVAILAVICVFFLLEIHRGILSVKNPNLRIISAACASSCFAAFFSGLLSGSSINVYPVNFLFWSFIGCTLVLVGSERAKQGARRLPSEATPRRLAPMTTPSSRRPVAV